MCFRKSPPCLRRSGFAQAGRPSLPSGPEALLGRRPKRAKGGKEGFSLQCPYNYGLINKSDSGDLTLGHIVSHNKKAEGIVIKTDKSTGHWRLSNHTVVLSGKKRLTLSEISSKIQKVRVHASKDGEIQRIFVLEWK